MKESKIDPVKASQLEALFQKADMPPADLLNSLGLYLRTSGIIKLLFLNELYQEIKDIPGAIMEFGCWRGQNLVVFENLRAIYEPFRQRRIVGFDTFEGHTELSKSDIPQDTLKPDSYALPAEYPGYLRDLLAWHQGNNVLKGIRPHEVISGDVSRTLPAYLNSNPTMRIALAYFDMGLYEPTYDVLQAIRRQMLPGSVIMLDEYDNPDYPGETQAFHEVFEEVDYQIKWSAFMPNRAIIKVKR